MAGRRAVVGGVFEGLSNPCPGPDQVLRPPRISQVLQEVAALELGTDDLRKVAPEKLAELLAQSEKEPEKRSSLALAVFCGTAQASIKGLYWSPNYASAVEEVECAHFMRPVSCVHPAGKMPGNLKASGVQSRITCMHRCNPIDAALELSKAPENRHVAIVRFTSVEHPRSQVRRYTNIHEDQLLLRTTYYEAFERLAEDVQVLPGDVLREGGIIYSSGVGIFRGPLSEGAPWIEKPPQIDVIWVGLPAHPHMFEQELYYAEQERAFVAGLLDRTFAWAVSHGADAVVMPPLGCCMGGCDHPRLQVAGMIHEAAQLHSMHLPVVCVASDHPAHCEAAWWDDFAVGVMQGRPRPPPIIYVPEIPLMIDQRRTKDSNDMLEKRRKQLGVLKAGGGRPARNSFI